MTENQTVCCHYCKGLISKDAKVCLHCGHYQNIFRWLFSQCVKHIIPIFISVGLLFFTYQQYYEAKKERVKAQDALLKAQKAEKKISDASKAIAKVLLAQSTLKGDADSLDVLTFFPAIMKNEAKSLLDAIEVNTEERQNIYKLSDLLNEWQQTTDPVRKEALGKKIEQLINQ